MKIPKNIDDLFNESDQLNSAIIRQKWFKESELFKTILEKSSFLPTDSKFCKRVHINHLKLTSEPVCSVCGETANFNPYAGKYGEYTSSCKSRSCIAKSTTEKRKNTLIKKYGSLITENHMSKNATAVQHFVAASKETIKKKYGVTSPSLIPGWREKSLITIEKNYGVKHPAHIPKNIQLKKERSLSFFQELSNMVEIISIDEPLIVNRMICYSCTVCNQIDRIPSETFKWRCSKLGTACEKCSGVKSGSTFQTSITDFVRSICSSEVLSNTRTILPSGKELDIWIPDLKIAIEANGVYWHSTKNKDEDAARKMNHINKTKECEALGIRLIHIFEDSWYIKQDVVKSRLSSIFGNVQRIYARRCTTVSLTKQEERKFLSENHIQGFVSSSYNIALMFGQNIVALMTFGKSRFIKGEGVELLRFCSVRNTQVVGGASKLLKAALNKLQNQTVISYSDRTWGSGNVYKQLGFVCISNSAPSYKWIKNWETKSRFATQKHKLQELLPKEQYNKDLSESENMFNAGWRRIWDCGTTKWILKTAIS